MRGHRSEATDQLAPRQMDISFLKMMNNRQRCQPSKAMLLAVLYAELGSLPVRSACLRIINILYSTLASEKRAGFVSSHFKFNFLFLI